MYRSPPRTPDATIDICFTWEDVEDFVLQTPLVSGGSRTGDEEPVPFGVECPLGCKFAEKWPSVVAHSTFLRRPQTPDATLNTLRFMFFAIGSGIVVCAEPRKPPLMVGFVNRDFPDRAGDAPQLLQSIHRVAHHVREKVSGCQFAATSVVFFINVLPTHVLRNPTADPPPSGTVTACGADSTYRSFAPILSGLHHARWFSDVGMLDLACCLSPAFQDTTACPHEWEHLLRALASLVSEQKEPGVPWFSAHDPTYARLSKRGPTWSVDM